MEHESGVIRAFPKQSQYIDAVLSGKYRFLMYAGGVGGGKTLANLMAATALCKFYPGSRWAFVRKTRKDITEKVIPEFNKMRPGSFFGETKDASHRFPWHTPCENGSMIIWWPESTHEGDTDMNRWRGLNVNGFFFEEANECYEKSWVMAQTRAGRWKVPPGKTQPPPILAGSCNPSQSWVRTMFYDPWVAGQLDPNYFFLQAFPLDNPHLDPQYLESLEFIPRAMYETMVNGNWDFAEQPDAVIQAAWVSDAFRRERDTSFNTPRLGVDVARFGDDKSVWCVRLGNHIEELVVRAQWDAVEAAELTVELAKKYSIPGHSIILDTIGPGGPVADILRHNHDILVTPFIAGVKKNLREIKFGSDLTMTFANLRTDAWWGLRELLDPDYPGGMLSINPELQKHSEIMGDLTAVRYSFIGERMIQLEPKNKTKIRLRRSPDFGDAIMQACAPSVAQSFNERMGRLASYGRSIQKLKGHGYRLA